MLDRVEEYVGRFVAYPSDHARIACVLWAAHAHLLDAFDSTPRLAFLSPEPGSGKTRALDVMGPLVPRPVHSHSATPAYLLRKIADPAGPPTVLYDEIDALFGPKAKGDSEDVRALLNAGHRKGAVAGRCVVRGKAVETEELPAYSAVALAGLGTLPDTLMVIRMRKRAPHEIVEPWRPRDQGVQGEAVGKELAEWAGQVRHLVAHHRPELPRGVEDRNADVWEPLIAVADTAGGDWPWRARAAAVSFVSAKDDRLASAGVQLLADLRTIFGEAEALSTTVTLTRLNDLEEAPWGNLRGQPLDARALARLLRPYGVSSTKVRIDGVPLQGYRRGDLWDAWVRYLPHQAATERAEQTEHPTPDASRTQPMPLLVPEQAALPSGGEGRFTSPVPTVPHVPEEPAVTVAHSPGHA